MTRAVKRPLLKYFGGKFRIAPWIISHFPSHSSYVEPFGGGGSVLIAKSKSQKEVYNDLNRDLFAIFKVMRDADLSKELRNRLELTLYARSEFEMGYEETNIIVEQAARAIIRSHFGWGGVGVVRRTGFNTDQKAAALWATFLSEFDNISDRLMGVIVECLPAISVMERYDSKNCLHYVDPPYPVPSRSDKKCVYKHEMSDEDHDVMIGALRSLNGTVILSGYDYSLYNDRLGDWRRVELPTTNLRGHRATECLWINR